MQVVFATCEQQPLIAEDDQPLADALAARGAEVTPIPWTEIDPYSVHDSPPILIRSTWDYHRNAHVWMRSSPVAVLRSWSSN